MNPPMTNTIPETPSEGNREAYLKIADAYLAAMPDDELARLVEGMRRDPALSQPAPVGWAGKAPEPPWPPGSTTNARREGWAAYFAGRKQDDCPFPAGRNDLELGYRHGWETARIAYPASPSTSRGGGFGVLPPIALHEAWQPIETAPRDKGAIVYDAARWGVCEAFNYIEGGWKAHGVNGSISLRPTHWQPLPSPPTLDASGAVGGSEQKDRVAQAGWQEGSPNRVEMENERLREALEEIERVEPLTASDVREPKEIVDALALIDRCRNIARKNLNHKGGS